MTLKDLRVSKGLSQAACAAYLGMSTRNYQNYENDPKKANTAKYNAIYQKLEVLQKQSLQTNEKAFFGEKKNVGT